MKTTPHISHSEPKFEVDEHGKLTGVVKQPATPEPEIHEQLDWSIPKHREAWAMHLRFQGVKGIATFIEKNPPPKEMGNFGESLVETFEFFGSKLNTAAWELTYAIFPHIKGIHLFFDAETGKITNNEDFNPDIDII